MLVKNKIEEMMMMGHSNSKAPNKNQTIVIRFRFYTFSNILIFLGKKGKK